MCSIAPESANQKLSLAEEEVVVDEVVTQYASLETDEQSDVDSDLMELAVTCVWLFLPL
jgi:hypothetical protein